jgi:geranylgeranyl diphosphate synthase type II
MIHTYSLIHDDLPSMDNDDLRRGRPTLHRVFSEGAAILAGDGLLTLAFAIIGSDQQLTDHEVRRIVIQLATGAGCRGMVGGQQADLDAEGKAVTPEELEYIHAHKTAALLTASVLCGAIAAGANEEQLNCLAKYGQAIGMAFQIKDDLLDIEGDRSKLGKSIGKDARAGKATYPSVWGREAAREQLDLAVAQALASLEGLGKDADPLREIARFIAQREK